MPDALTLDPDDLFDAALIPIVEMNRRKRLDYATDGDPFSNFRETSALLGMDGFDATMAALFNVLQKITRLRALRANGRPPANETVMDTYLDLAVYAVILFGINKEVSATDHHAQDCRPRGIGGPDHCGLCGRLFTEEEIEAALPPSNRRVGTWTSQGSATGTGEAPEEDPEYDEAAAMRSHLHHMHNYPRHMVNATADARLKHAHYLEHHLQVGTAKPSCNHSEAWLGPWQ